MDWAAFDLHHVAAKLGMKAAAAKYSFQFTERRG
ncbi:hypothetical protein JOC74_001582 [Bacillus capparidis]|uniref:Uncharacterized protein n=1 Tax=Bacillus capparidis TaxID=1840411 RepID=A0ABS4CVJ0_9BACI|nr:hypothetical protein [Bacillus capparidis]